MSKLPKITLASLLILVVAIGCSSSDQGAIDKTVSATLATAQPATATATAAPTSTSMQAVCDPVPEAFTNRGNQIVQANMMKATDDLRQVVQ